MAKTKWDGTQIPAQHGRLAIVTGANQGLGFQVALRLAERGAHVVLACRSQARAEDAVQRIREQLLSFENPGHVEFMLVDVGSLESVRAFSEAFHAKFDRLDILINNAGVASPAERLSADGLSIQFGVNYLGHFYLTTLLFDLLKKSSDARIVPISSAAHRLPATYLLCRSPKLDLANIHKPESGINWVRYEKSKLLCLIFAHELHRRLEKAGITNVKCVPAQPGVCHTNIFDEPATTFMPSCTQGLAKKFCMLVMQDVHMGSLPILYAATESDIKSGEYMGCDGPFYWLGYPIREISSKTSRDEDLGLEVWELSEKHTKTPFHVA